ncbi:hypothetical protein SDC9_131036 [bioreactor metagenome]|uniref:Uncharacterized protein n=1 Tax=bioreactor metagenome TaxID=1076179 RepID=A0A645D3L1_9ZZZZ
MDDVRVQLLTNNPFIPPNEVDAQYAERNEQGNENQHEHSHAKC